MLQVRADQELFSAYEEFNIYDARGVEFTQMTWIETLRFMTRKHSFCHILKKWKVFVQGIRDASASLANSC